MPMLNQSNDPSGSAFQQGQIFFDAQGKAYQMGPQGTPIPVTPPSNVNPAPQGINIGQAWGEAQKSLDKYNSSVTKAPTVSGLEKGLENVGPYQAYDWNIPQYNLPTYDKTNFNFADQYQAPAAYQGYQYNTPQVASVNSIAPEADATWNARRTATNEQINKQFDDTRTRVHDAIVSGQTRPEQAAALLASIGDQEGAARIGAQRDIDTAQSGQLVGIRQQEQQIQAQQNSQNANLNLQTQEQMAQQVAQKYNLDVDAARYLVQQYQTQQQAQAGENQVSFQADQGNTKFNLGMQQWLQEQQAAEKEKAYQSQYGLAQDVAQTKMNENQFNESANTNYQNALLQGAQGATGQFSQGATYQTNLTEAERKKQIDSNNFYEGLVGGVTGQVGQLGGQAAALTTQSTPSTPSTATPMQSYANEALSMSKPKAQGVSTNPYTNSQNSQPVSSPNNPNAYTVQNQAKQPTTQPNNTTNKNQQGGAYG